MRATRSAFLACAIFGAGILLILADAMCDDQAVTPDSAVPAASAQPVFGPGQLPRDSTPAAPLAVAAADDHDDLFATEDQNLIINPELLRVLNAHLLPTPGQPQIDALTAYLKAKLPPKAFSQAADIVQHYRSYIIEHDQLLDAQGLQWQNAALASLDLNRIASWQQQRLRLRERLLGEEVTNAWYQNDDANLLQAIEDLKLARATPGQMDGKPADIESDRVMRDVLSRACAHLTDAPHAH